MGTVLVFGIIVNKCAETVRGEAVSLSEPAAVVVASVITGLMTGGPAVLAIRRTKRREQPPATPTDKSWQKQAKELADLLERQHAERHRLDEEQIGYLRQQLGDCLARRGTKP